MAGDWRNDPNYSHRFLVPLFNGYLIWQQRDSLSSLVSSGSWLGLPLLLAGLAELLLGVFGPDDFLTRSSLIVVLAGLTLFHFGTAAFRAVAFPLAFLFFMVPLPVKTGLSWLRSVPLKR